MNVEDVRNRLTQIEHLNRTGIWPGNKIPDWVNEAQHGSRVDVNFAILDFYEKAVPLLLGEIQRRDNRWTRSQDRWDSWG